MDKTRVLLADDFEIIRKSIKTIIEDSERYVVVDSVPTGREAVASYFVNSPDLVLMDIEMENKSDGIVAVEEILAKDPDAMLVYLTSHDSDDVILAAMATGALDYIVKGCSDDELIHHLDEVVQGHARLEENIRQVLMAEYKRLRKSEEGLLYFIKNLSKLTPAERQLVALLLKGMKVKDIANYRNVEIVTVKSQIRTLLQKVGCSRTKELINSIEALNLSYLFE